MPCFCFEIDSHVFAVLSYWEGLFFLSYSYFKDLDWVRWREVKWSEEEPSHRSFDDVHVDPVKIDAVAAVTEAALSVGLLFSCSGGGCGGFVGGLWRGFIGLVGGGDVAMLRWEMDGLIDW
jgi:hypothetical protein